MRQSYPIFRVLCLIICILTFFIMIIFIAISVDKAWSKVVDTGESRQGFMGDSDARIAVIESVYLSRSNKPKLLFFGSSNVREGFRPEDIMLNSYNIEAHNLAVGAATPLHLLRLWDHIEASVDRNVAQKSVVVIGLFYGLLNDFWEDRVKNEEKRIWFPITLYRTFHYADLLNFYKKILLFQIEMNAKYSLFVDKLALYFDTLIFAHSVYHAEEKISKSDYSDHKAALDRWKLIMGDKKTIPNRQYMSFIQLIEKIRAAGFGVLVVNMPLPSWHRNASTYDKLVQVELVPLIVELTSKDNNINFIDLHSSFPDTDFYDSAHPTRMAAKRWGRHLINLLERSKLLSQMLNLNNSIN